MSILDRVSGSEEQSAWKRAIFGDTNLEDPDYPVDHVPDSERRGLLSISAVLLGFVFFAGTIWAGADVGAVMSFSGLITVMTIGYVILGVYVALLCAIAAKAGLTSVLLARYTFGDWGAKWADVLLGGTQVGWFGVTVPLIAIPTAKFLGINTPVWASALIVLWGLLHLSTAYFGYDGMEKLSYASVPIIFAVGVISIVIAVGDAGGIAGLFGSSGSDELSLGAAVTIVVGTFISGGTQAPNWARFASSKRIAFWAGLFAFLLGNGFLFLSGAVGGAVYDVTPEGDLYAVLATQGLAAIGLFALMLNIWTTNDNTAYAFGLAGSEAFDYDRKRPFVLAGGAVGILLALVGADDLLIPWLSTLGQYVPPLGGVIIADFLLCWRLSIPRMDDVDFTGIRWVGIGAYLVGCVVASLTAGAVVPGLGAPQVIPGIAALNGIVAAGVIHTLGHYLLERTDLLAGHDVATDSEWL
jgi:cytosine permease